MVVKMNNESGCKAEDVKCGTFICTPNTLGFTLNENLEPNLHSVIKLKREWPTALSISDQNETLVACSCVF